MTNKEYKRLTTYNSEFDHPAMTATRGEDTTEVIAKHIERLYELEECIENGTLVFLPCKVGDKFWWIYTSPIGEKKVRQEEVYSISIMKDGRFLLITFDCCFWELREVYFSKEAAEKALEENND